MREGSEERVEGFENLAGGRGTSGQGVFFLLLASPLSQMPIM